MSSEIVDNHAINQSEDVSLKQIVFSLKKEFFYILSKWLILLAAIVCGAALGVTYATLKKTYYTASTTFVLENGTNAGGIGQYAGLASMVGLNLGDSGGGIFQGDNLFELYKSRNMLQRALLSEVNIDGKPQKLIYKYIAINNLDKQLKTKISNFSVLFNSQNLPKATMRLRDSVLATIVDDVNRNYIIVSKPDKKLSIIRVDVRAADEEFAKLFNDQIVKTVNDFYIQTKTRKSLSNLAILQHQTDSVKRVLNSSIYNSAAVADRTPNLNPTRQVLRSSVQQYQVNAEANKEILSQLIQNLELSKLALRNETPLIQIIDSPILPLAKDRLGKFRGMIFGGIFGAFFCVVCLVGFRKIASFSAN